jgi:hypothetical protein
MPRDIIRDDKVKFRCSKTKDQTGEEFVFVQRMYYKQGDLKTGKGTLIPIELFNDVIEAANFVYEFEKEAQLMEWR